MSHPYDECMAADEIRELFPAEYPKQLRELPDPPAKLWIRGSLPPVGTKFLTVVGSRALSRYGREACEHIIYGLQGYPISIVSGLALGADACAHTAALKADLHTIAIPGSGLRDSVIGPRSNLGLAHSILDAGGALVSENEPDYLSHPYDFPSRNRIMVGMSDAVLVVEAGPQSGTLITGRLASEYSRELLCIPHRISDIHNFGMEVFTRIGAAIVTKPEHILEALHIEPRSSGEQRPAPSLTAYEKIIFDLLAEPLARDELIRRAELPIGVTLTTLISLEMKGFVKEELSAWRRI